MNNRENAIIIFCRYPSEGKVKTRLAEAAGWKIAAECYRLCAEHTFKECGKLYSNKICNYVFYSEKGEEDKIKKWIGPGFEYFQQTGNNLGEKMADSFTKVFEKNTDKAILIGTDIPDITAEILNVAFVKLDNADYVIGPASDGGFYLIGTKRFNPDLFNGIKWGGDKVYETVAGKLKKKNLKTEKTAELIDIDTIDDVELWFNRKSGSEDNELKIQIKKLFSSYKSQLNNYGSY